MKKNSTTQKGSEFEEKVFQIIRGLLDNGDFFVSGKNSFIYRNKPYYSNDRKDNIIVDISIETFLAKADTYSILTIIECKNYNEKGVPVDDIEEFDSKLRQIGEHNTKGVIITNSCFQKGTISLAKSKKIGLVRINDRREVDWVNYRKGEEKKTLKESVLTELSSINSDYNFISLLKNDCFLSLPNLLIELGVIDKYSNKPKYINIPYRTEKEIDEIIASVNFEPFYYNDQLDIDLIIEFLRNSYKVKFQFDLNLGIIGTQKILGKINFNPLEIYICKELQKDKYRLRFTLAHEIGHLILHYEVLQKYLDENLDNDTTIDLNFDNLISYYNNRLEIQANIFASRLLIPYNKLITHVADYFVRENIHKGFLFIDQQWCNIDLLTRLLKELQDHFFVSKEVARVRLINEGLLRDRNDLGLPPRKR